MQEALSILSASPSVHSQLYRPLLDRHYDAHVRCVQMCVIKTNALFEFLHLVEHDRSNYLVYSSAIRLLGGTRRTSKIVKLLVNKYTLQVRGWLA